MRRLIPLSTPLVLAWALWHARRLRRTGRPLSADEQAIALAVGVRDPARVRVMQVERMPLPAARLLERLAYATGLPPPRGIDGMTLGHGIYLRGGRRQSPRLLAHELRHVQQCERAGSMAAFLARYLWQVARHGYRDAPFEADARRAAAAWHATSAAPVPADGRRGS